MAASATAADRVGTMQSEEQRIIDEVEKRKERAQQSGAITSAFNLYHYELRHYDVWAKNCPHLLHPEIKVTQKLQARGPSASDELIDATIGGNEYFFKFRERSTYLSDGELGELAVHGYLDVDFQGQRVMTIDCGTDGDGHWYTGDVSAFIEGPWIDELNSVFADVRHLHEEDNKRLQEQRKKEETEKLKKNFGL
jgi:hypothetical protein